MTNLSVKQKALIFLNKYKSLDTTDIYNTPWELTQDGVANALCISRAHACIVLNQLKSEDMVEEKITHIKNGKIRRKSYFILPAGMEEASDLLKTAEKENIDLSFILDSKKQGTSISLDKLNESDRYALGCACAFNTPVQMSILPQFKNVSVPVDVNGYVQIDSDLRDNVLNSASEEEKATWHGYAANYWFDRRLTEKKNIEGYFDCIHGLLYQYVESGRNRDACKLIKGDDLFNFINTITDQLHETMMKVRPVDRYAREVLMLSISTHLEYREIEEAERDAEELKKIDSVCASVYFFDIEMLKGDRDAAEKAIADTWQKDPMAAVRKASLLREEGKLKEARELLMSIDWGIYDEGFSNFEMDKFIELARIDCAEGHYDDAYQRLSKTEYIINDAKYGARFLALKKQVMKKLNI